MLDGKKSLMKKRILVFTHKALEIQTRQHMQSISNLALPSITTYDYTLQKGSHFFGFFSFK